MVRIFGWLACFGALALLILAMTTGTRVSAANAVRIDHATVRLSPVPGRPAAGYFTITAGSAAVELTGVVAAHARVELHGMSMAGNVMRMNRLPSVRVAAGRTVRFAPGGSHLMIFDLPATASGATMPLTFAFADGTRVDVTASVVAAGAAAMPMTMPMPMPHGAH